MEKEKKVKGEDSKGKGKGEGENNVDGTPMKYKFGKICCGFQSEKNGGIEYKFPIEDSFHEHAKVGWPTFYQLWPSKQSGAKKGETNRPPTVAGKAKANAKGTDKGGKAPAAVANVVGGGDYGSTKTWQPKNAFEEAEGDVEDE